MKKFVSVLLALVFVFSAIPLNTAMLSAGFAVNANAASADDLTFKLTIGGQSYSVYYCDENASGSLTIPSTYNGKPVTSIGDYAFYECSSLTSVTIGDSVTNIGDEAFYSCDSLTSVTIPDSVTSIGDYAFENCSSLTSVTIPDSVTSIGYAAFYDCRSLTAINVSSGNKNFSSQNGVLFNKDKTELICYPGGKSGAYTIPDSVTSIGNSAFAYCSSLTSVTIPDSVTSIGNHAFAYCSSLTSVTIPDSVTSIGDWAFYNCSSLTSVTIGDNVTSIGYWAFDCCRSLTIYGFENSYAQKYAKENSIKFVALASAPAATKLGKISNTSTGIKISWTAVAGADSYIVYRKAGSATSWSRLAVVDSSKTSYTDTSVKTGTTYTYTVKAQNENGAGGYNKTGLKTVCLTQPTVKVANKNGYVNVTWGKITGAKGYYVYRKAGSATSWTKVATVKDGATVSYSDKNVKSGTSYTYTVKAYNGSYVSSYCSGIATKYLAQPEVKVANKNGYVNVSWGKISGAKGYYVYRKAGSATSWTKVATIKDGSTVSYTDKNVKNGTTYKYTVKAYNGSYASSYCSGIATKYLTPGKVSSATSAKAGITVKWGKNASASGYYVYRKTGSGSFAKIATVKGAATVSYVDKSAKKGTTYTYCVRPYSGSYSGTYANTINCKDKY